MPRFWFEKMELLTIRLPIMVAVSLFKTSITLSLWAASPLKATTLSVTTFLEELVILDVAEIGGARLRADEVAPNGARVRGGDLHALLAVARDQVARRRRRYVDGFARARGAVDDHAVPLVLHPGGPADVRADEVTLDHVVGVDS
jgi:hypothetical protein